MYTIISHFYYVFQLITYADCIYYVVIKDNLKQKDQSLRKVDQEMESLNFRNQQLTKRVSVLQDELDDLQVCLN